MLRSRRKRTGTGTTPNEERQIAPKTARTAKREKYSAEEKTKPAGPAMDENARPKKEFRGG